MDKLKTAWQSFANTFMNSDFLKGGVSALTEFVELVEKLVDSLGSFGTIGLGAGIFGLFKNRKGIFGDLSAFGSLALEVIGSSDKLGTKFKNLGKAAGMAGGSITKGLTSSLSGVVGAIGLVVAAVGLAINAYKNYREEISKTRQETIQASDEFLNAAGSFEQAYIKYSGRTDLTAEEEAELEFAINGTVDALKDKSSALHGVVNSSNDYVAALEAITDAELKAAEKAAQEKQKNAKLELEDATKDWYSNNTARFQIKNDSTALKIAQEMDTDFLQKETNGKKGHHVSTYWFDMPSDADANKILDYYYTLVEYKNKLLEVDDFDTNTDIQSAYEDVNASIEKLSETVKVYEDGLYDLAKAEYQAQNGIPKTTEAYLEMREAILTREDMAKTSLDTRMSILNSLDSDYSKYFDLSTAEAQARKFIGIIKGFGDGTKDGTNEIGTVETFLNMRTALNNNECTVGEYLSELDNITSMSEKFSDEEKKQFNLAYGLDTDSIKEQYEDVYNYIKRTYLDTIDASDYPNSINAWEHAKEVETERIQSILKGLSAAELQAVANIKGEINWETTNTDDILAQIKKEAEFIEAMNFTISMDVETESLDAFNTAMAESVSATGLSSEAIAALKGRYAELASQGYDLSAMFEETSNGIHLNREAVSELEQAYASQKLTEADNKLGILKTRYDELTDKINNCNDASERASLYREQQSIAQKINDLGTLAAQYDGLASSYNAWLSAEEAGSERDMYEQVIEGFENIGDEIKRGWLDDGTIKFLELMTGQTDLAGKSASELKEIWNGLDDTIKGTSYSVKDFFTVDKDGNSTSSGVYNFLKAIEELKKNGTLKAVKDEAGNLMDISKLIERNSDDKITAFNFDVVGGDKAVAEALGISEELVQIMQRAADDAGFVVTLDGSWTQFADLKDQAEKANDALKKIAQTNDHLKNAGFGDYEFKFDASDIETLDEELNKAKELLNNPAFQKDGKFNIDAEGAKDALKIAETLQIAKSQLEQPAYMSIDTTKLQKDLQEPVKLLQDFEKKSQTIELLKLTPDINKDKISELDGELDKIAESLYNIKDENIKVKLGIDGKTPEQIREELENGTIEVPAELTIEANIDKNLEDLLTLGLLENELITEAEAKVRLGLEVENEDDVKKSLEQKVAEATSEPIMSNAVVNMSNIIGKYAPEDQEVVIKYLADTREYDNFEAEDKEAVVKFIADSIDVEGYKPEDKQAYAKYIADGGNLDAYKPEQKEAIVKYFTEDSNIENYQGEDKEAIVRFLAETSDADGYTPQDRQAIAKFIRDSIDVDNYQMPTNKMAYAKYLKDTHDIDIWTPPLKTGGEAEYSPYLISTTLPVLTGGIARYTATVAKADGTANINGTAFANGTTGRAFKKGDWGVKKTETALTGELGPEIVVYGSKYWTVGENGAEFAKIPKGAIVFNHKQTEELLKNGKVTSGGGRGKFYANGTAFAQGTAYGSGSGGGIEPTVTSYTVGKNKNTGTSYKKSDDDDFEETFDWIEIAIDRVERAIDQLDTKANSVYRSWSERNSNLTSEISKVRSEISLQQQAYQEYMNAAAGVGLSSSWVSKIKNGQIDITTVKDEALAEKIKDYQNWYEKALDCKDAILELQETESKLYAQRFENIQTQYDGILQGYEHTEAMLNEYISQAEEQGYIVSKKYYEALVTNEKQNINALKQEQANLIAARDEAVASGKIAKNSEEWVNMCNEIDSVTQSIEESTSALLEFDNAMREIDWSVFDLIQERISGITEESDFLIELLSNKKLFDDNGNLTSQGSATVALHAQNANSYMYQADTYGEEIAKLDKQIQSDPYDQELINRRNELLELQRESILNYEQEKEAIKDLVSEGIDAQLDALQELIDKKNEQLQSEKDLYEYSKKITEQSKAVAVLEKQLAAYSSDNSEEARQKVQQIKVDLESARQDLQETEMDKILDDTSAMLDDLFLEAETLLNTRIDNIDALLESAIENANANATSIQETLTSETDKVGITLSNAMNSIWSGADGSAKSVLTMYGEDFRTKSATIITTLNGIKSSVNSMVSSLNKEATTKTTANKTTTSAKKNPTTSSSTTTTKKTTTTTKKSSSGDGKPKIGDRVKYVSGQYYYDSQGSKPLGSHNKGEYVYITNINTRDWATHGYHISTGNKLGKGDLGWLKLNQLSGYASGKKNFLDDETAWTQEDGREFIVRPSDGAILTPIAKGDSVLNAAASGNIWNMANSPAEFIKENLGIGGANVPHTQNVSNSYTQHIDNVILDFKNVKNYDEMLTQMQHDKSFEKLIMAMTIDRIAGKSSLAKGKAIR